MTYTAPADLPAQWRAKADELETGIEARTLRECAAALAESLYANASAYLDRLGIPAFGGHVEATPPATEPNAASPEFWNRMRCLDCGVTKTMHNFSPDACGQWRVEVTSPPSVPVSPPCTCGHPRSDHAYYADGCWPDNGFDHCTCRTYTPKR